MRDRQKIIRWVKSIVRTLVERHECSRISFAQEGEDLVLQRFFDGQHSGFYVDVGAHHPFRFSNTYFFYRLGWYGINVDASPGSMQPFVSARRRDINIEAAISESNAALTFHLFNEPALNTFDHAIAKERDGRKGYRIVGTTKILPMTLADLLDQHLPTGVETIDFLSVDVEGHDLSVLRSNDWARFRPMVVVAELVGATIEDFMRSELTKFMRSVGYVPVAKAVNSVFFKNDGAQESEHSPVSDGSGT